MPAPTIGAVSRAADHGPIDQWTPLEHKQPLADPQRHGVAADWAPDPTDQRRIAAYYILACYLNNAARRMLPKKRREAHREYGDPALHVGRVVAGILGDQWGITIDGATLDASDGPPIQPPPPEPGPDAHRIEQAVYETKLRVWERDSQEALDGWLTEIEGLPDLRYRLDALREWAERRQFAGRVVEAETDAVGYGDTVYALWPQQDDWPKLSIVAPDSYFPVLRDDDASEYPDRVDIAWEFLDDDGEPWLRRRTWRLVDLAALRTTVDDDGELAWDGLGEGERVVVDGDGTPTVERWQPWHTDGEPGATRTCIYTEDIWLLRDLSGEKLRDLPGHAAHQVTAPTDLGVDFIPLVHIPNTPASQGVWGESGISPVAQVADDIALNDRDAMQASRYLSDPTIFASGVTGTIGDFVAPGMFIRSGSEHGRMDVLDLSGGLQKLTEAGDRLQDRYWQNAAMPAEMVGRIDETNAAVSGVALALRFAPFAQAVAILRMVREPKYQLLLKFAQRLAQVAGALEPGPTPVARLEFGSFLPTNRLETMRIVAEGLRAHAISRDTGIALLVAAGFPVDDAHTELERIQAVDAETARAMADATGSEQAAADYLGVTIPGRPVDLPGIPGLERFTGGDD